MSKYNFDSAKDLFPKIDLSKVLEEQVHTYDPSVYNPHIPEIDPDELSINRTAKSADQIVELLQEIKQSDEVEARLQAKRHNLFKILCTILAPQYPVKIFFLENEKFFRII